MTHCCLESGLTNLAAIEPLASPVGFCDGGTRQEIESQAVREYSRGGAVAEREAIVIFSNVIAKIYHGPHKKIGVMLHKLGFVAAFPDPGECDGRRTEETFGEAREVTKLDHDATQLVAEDENSGGTAPRPWPLDGGSKSNITTGGDTAVDPSPDPVSSPRNAHFENSSIESDVHLLHSLRRKGREREKLEREKILFCFQFFFFAIELK